jgi:hypothetical protein
MAGDPRQEHSGMTKVGTYEVTFNASKYPSGVYFYRLQVGEYNESKRMLLIK